MKIITAENGKKTVKISKSEWETIGKKNGWMKTSQGMGMNQGEYLKKFQDWIIPILKGVNSNYLVKPSQIGMAEYQASEARQLVDQLINIFQNPDGM